MIASHLPVRSGKAALWIMITLSVVVVAVVGGYWITKWSSKTDAIAAVHANNRGIGHMERFEYGEAIEAFEKASRLAPDWEPARINLGIALLNEHSDANLNRAIDIFEKILKRDDKHPYAHFCLGVILAHQNKINEASDHFRKVTEIDPSDASAWYRLGLNSEDPKAKLTCYKRAVDIDPYFNAALYGLFMEMRSQDMAKAKEILDEQIALKESLNYTGPQKDIRYSEMGQYADVIGRAPPSLAAEQRSPLPLFAKHDGLRVKLRSGARWAAAADFGKGPTADLRRRIRDRFGAVMVALDYNRDNRLDLFLLGAVVVNGKVEDLLLRNDGDGAFTDVTIEAGLAGARLSLGCCVGDFDNNGYPDLFVTGIGEQKLFRNTGLGRFEDVTGEAGLDKLKTVCLGAAFVDLDQDGDLDLVVAQYADSPEHAVESLESNKPPAGPGLAVFLNVGEAPVTSPAEDPPALTPHFRRAEKPAALLAGDLSATTLLVGDL
ncbi:MAG: tetratricopeptide repeat protein, partial [Planctomycetota bacterium]